MDRKVSRRTTPLRLPLAQKNENKVTGIDERANDGYDSPDTLVIETSRDSLSSNDSTERWMKTGSKQSGDQQQLCQIDIGNNIYVVGNTFVDFMFYTIC